MHTCHITDPKGLMKMVLKKGTQIRQKALGSNEGKRNFSRSDFDEMIY
jgi:hypothetical protein